jgi:hypothetical protein
LIAVPANAETARVQRAERTHPGLVGGPIHRWTQGVGKISVDVAELDVDQLTVVGHKRRKPVTTVSPGSQ